MATDEIPEDVRSFLLEHIESYAQLEVLALLRKQPARGFSSEAAAAEANLPESAAEAALDELRRSGVLELTVLNGRQGFRYRPRKPETDRTVARLLQAFEENPIAIVKLMNATAMERVRTSAMRAFANAFVLARKKKDE
jgi:DNA-binding IscR family transcriptional regulator